MKFSGMVGYKIQEEVAPGIWQNRIVERKCIGDVIQTAWHSQAAATTINDNAKLNVQIEIVAGAWAHYGDIVRRQTLPAARSAINLCSRMHVHRLNSVAIQRLDR